MADIRNPFEHHHGHDHDHDHGHDHAHDAPSQDLDPAQQSLNDALRVSFWVLKVAMLIVVVLYLFSGFFSVKQQEVAVRLRFGQIVGDPGKQEIPPGGPHFALPFPLEQVVRVPTNVQQLDFSSEFWFRLRPEDLGFTIDELSQRGALKSEPLNPELDGSMVTGDANIVHARWSLSYKIDDAVRYLKNIGDPKLAQKVVRSAAESGIVRAAAGLTADEIIKGQIDRESAIRDIQQSLDAVGAGISVEQIAIFQPTPPVAVRDAFQAVTRAESEKARVIEKALQDRSTILGETAGEAYGPILAMIRDYERVLATADADAIAAQEEKIDSALGALKVESEIGNVPISGRVAQVINEAVSYRSSIDARVRADADNFRTYFNEYKDRPARRRIIIDRLWQEAKAAIFTGDVETLYVPPGRAWIKLNRDPDVARQRQLDDLKARGLDESEFDTGLKSDVTGRPR